MRLISHYQFLWCYNMNNINKEMLLTAHNMEKIVYPQIKKELKWFRRSTLYSIENNKDNTLQMLDTRCAIDGYIFKSDGAIPIATRCQYGEKSWSTFTIRRSLLSGSETEYDKVSNAINKQLYTRPQLSIHAYLTRRNNGKLISVGIAKTEDIFSLINKNKWRHVSDGNTFYYVSWDDLETAGKKIKVIR